jgi:hypothetical protein
MTVGTPFPRVRASVLYALKHDGDIISPDGRATAILGERLEKRGAKQSNSNISGARRMLESEGLVTSETSATRVMEIRLVGVGDYVDPWSPEGEETYGSKTTVTRSPSSGPMTLDRARRTIEALPVTDRLMLAGEIVDNAAGELAERDEKLRKFGEMLRGV